LSRCDNPARVQRAEWGTFRWVRRVGRFDAPLDAALLVAALRDEFHHISSPPTTRACASREAARLPYLAHSIFVAFLRRAR